MKVIVLGSGLVGRPMAIDLVRDEEFEITIVDNDESKLNKIDEQVDIRKVVKDLSDPENVKEVIADQEIVVNGLPGFLGFETLKAVVEAGKNIVDIAFFSEDPFDLDDLAKRNKVTAVVDCGVSPGMSNILVGYVDSLLDKTENVSLYVGGLPELREWPYDYKAVFSPSDVIEEYVRPARYIENGKLAKRPALSDPEFINFPGVGTLEAFLSDGLRSLTRTIFATNMKEKTLRYPGHIEKMAMLRETGFFSNEPVDVGGQLIKPVEFTSKLLFPYWEMKDGDVDFTVLKLAIEGLKEGTRKRYTYNLFDRFDQATKTHSMARTTGYTATMAVRLIAKGLYDRNGISPPEFIGKQPNCVEHMLKGLRERGVCYNETIESI